MVVGYDVFYFRIATRTCRAELRCFESSDKPVLGSVVIESSPLSAVELQDRLSGMIKIEKSLGSSDSGIKIAPQTIAMQATNAAGKIKYLWIVCL